MLYGLYPRASMRRKVELKPVLTLKAKISYLKDITKRTSISYGRKYFAEIGQTIATLPIGYYDGYRRHLTNNADVLVGGLRCPVVGTVCMDHVMVNVTSVPVVDRFDEAVLIGRQGTNEITVDEIAERLSTINYEVTSSLSKRLPRIFIRGGKVVAVRNLLGYHSGYAISPEKIAGVIDESFIPDGSENKVGKKIRQRERLKI